MVQLSCGVQCTRSILFALNILFLLTGLSVMGVGIFIKASGNFRAISEIYTISDALGGEAMQWVGTGMILVGIFTACLAVFACLGAVLRNRCLLYAYSVLLIMIIIVEFAAVICVLVFRNDIWQSYDSGFMEVFHHSYSQNDTEAIKIIESLEREFQCCGVDGPSDYLRYGYKVPSSCYASQSSIHYLYTQGCAQAVTKWVWNKLPAIAGVLGSILFIEIFGVIASLVLGVAISHSANTGYYEKF